MILMTTHIMERAVRYGVERDGVEIWSRTVATGHRKTHRTGGPAFREAAREQERIAFKEAKECAASD